MAQVHALEFVEALVAFFAPHDINGGRNGVGKIRHDYPLLLQILFEAAFFPGPRLRAILTRP
ncbi:hypothetical protein D3C81_1751150 [compost metagenome]